MSKRLPVVLLLAAALGLTAVALPGAVSARTDPVRFECTADTPAVKALVDGVNAVKAAAADPVKLRTVLGDVYAAVTGAQESGCLPSLPMSPATVPSPPPAPKAVHACLAPTVDLLSAVLRGVSTTLATPPDPTAVKAAITELDKAVAAVNAAKCLPVALAVA